MRPKTWTPETLSTRVCVRGHVGNWIIRPKSSIACRDCLYEAQAKLREARRSGGSIPQVGQLQKLEAHIEKLEKALVLAKEKLELSRELVKLTQKMKDLGV